MSYAARQRDDDAATARKSPLLAVSQAGQAGQARHMNNGKWLQPHEQLQVGDTQRIQEAVQKIQGCAAAIRKETGVIGTASTYTPGKAHEAVREAKNTLEEAKSLLQGFAICGGGGGGSASEPHHRRLMQQKLTENLMGAYKSFEDSWKEYEVAEKDRANRQAAVAAATPQAKAGGRPRGGPGVELGTMESPQESVDVEAGVVVIQPGRQLQEMDVSNAEVETHAAIVEEYAANINQVEQDIRSLKNAMVTLAEHTVEQGEMLDNIEANMATAVDGTQGATQQLTIASQTQHRGRMRLLWMLAFVFVLAGILLILVVAEKR